MTFEENVLKRFELIKLKVQNTKLDLSIDSKTISENDEYDDGYMNNNGSYIIIDKSIYDIDIIIKEFEHLKEYIQKTKDFKQLNHSIEYLNQVEQNCQKNNN